MKNTVRHDPFFKSAMSDLRVARDFFSHYLPTDLIQTINLEDLTLCKDSFVEQNLTRRAVDMLYKTTFGGKPGYLYCLCEHQSEVDEWMPYRILKYTLAIMELHFKTSKKKSLPLVYCCVIYNGKKPYNKTTNLSKLIQAPTKLVEQYFLKPFQLIDLHEIKDETLRQQTWDGVVLFLLKHIYSSDFIARLKKIVKSLQFIEKHGGSELLTHMLYYVISKSDSKQDQFINFVVDHLPQDLGETAMTLADQFRDEGLQKGRLEGSNNTRVSIAKDMIRQGLGPDIVAKITKLPLQKIEQLVKYEKSE